MGIVGLGQPLQMGKQLIGNETPELVTQCLAARIVCRVFGEPAMFNGRPSGGVVPSMIEPAVEGMHHPVVRAQVRHQAAIFVLLKERRVAGVAVQ